MATAILRKKRPVYTTTPQRVLQRQLTASVALLPSIENSVKRNAFDGVMNVSGGSSVCMSGTYRLPRAFLKEILFWPISLRKKNQSKLSSKLRLQGIRMRFNISEPRDGGKRMEDLLQLTLILGLFERFRVDANSAIVSRRLTRWENLGKERAVVPLRSNAFEISEGTYSEKGIAPIPAHKNIIQLVSCCSGS